ncbi:MAG: DUF4468 domain-containing protein [Cyclobacteriaceae bacterium]
MKKIIPVLIFLLLLTTIHSLAQETLGEILPLEGGMVTYSDVVSVDQASADELYLRAKKWFVNTYKSANDVIQLDDKESGEIIGKGNFGIVYYSRDPSIKHTVSIAVKEGRYKYNITDLVYSDKQGDNFPIEQFPNGWAGKKKLYSSIDTNVSAIVLSIEKAMKSAKKDDW